MDSEHIDECANLDERIIVAKRKKKKNEKQSLEKSTEGTLDNKSILEDEGEEDTYGRESLEVSQQYFTKIHMNPHDSMDAEETLNHELLFKQKRKRTTSGGESLEKNDEGIMDTKSFFKEKRKRTTNGREFVESDLDETITYKSFFKEERYSTSERESVERNTEEYLDGISPFKAKNNRKTSGRRSVEKNAEATLDSKSFFKEKRKRTINGREFLQNDIDETLDNKSFIKEERFSTSERESIERMAEETWANKSILKEKREKTTVNDSLDLSQEYFTKIHFNSLTSEDAEETLDNGFFAKPKIKSTTSGRESADASLSTICSPNSLKDAEETLDNKAPFKEKRKRTKAGRESLEKDVEPTLNNKSPFKERRKRTTSEKESAEVSSSTIFSPNSLNDPEETLDNKSPVKEKRKRRTSRRESVEASLSTLFSPNSLNDAEETLDNKSPVKEKRKRRTSRRESVEASLSTIFSPNSLNDAEETLDNKSPVKEKRKRRTSRRESVEASLSTLFSPNSLNDAEETLDNKSPVKEKRKRRTSRRESVEASLSTIFSPKSLNDAEETLDNKSPIKAKSNIVTSGRDSLEMNAEEPLVNISFLGEESSMNRTEDNYGKFQKYNKDKQWKLEKIPHHLLPYFNLTDCTDINDVRDLPLLRVSLPHSLYVSPQEANVVDICHKRTIALSVYMHRLKSVRKAYLSAKKKSKDVRKNEKKGIFSSVLIDFAERRNTHPDKFFARDYDFYYTGGNLCVNPETNQVLHASGNNMDRIILSSFSVKDNYPKLDLIASADLSTPKREESEIFEVQFSRSGDSTFFVRQKHCISIQQHREKFYTLNSFQSKAVPLISFAQDKGNTNHLAISNLEHRVRLYDLENSSLIQTLQVVPKKDVKPTANWNMIRSWDNNVFIYAACRKLNVIDTRIPEHEWRSNYCAFGEDNYCSNFSSLALSSFDNLCYVGSSHKLYCIDRRFMGNVIDSKYTAVASWTHQMSCCPLITAASRHNDFEYIAAQSPIGADLRVFENIQCLAESEIPNSTEEEFTELGSQFTYKSPCLPYMPTSLETLFQEARTFGVCIKPGSGTVNRIKACTTGLSFVGDSSNPYILTATSNGDLFARHMFDYDNSESKPDHASAAEVMRQFEENICDSVRGSELQVTEVCDLSGISKVFRCALLSNLPQEEDALPIPQRRKYMGRWQKSVHTLHKYKDALAADLLSIWDIEEEEKDFNFTAFALRNTTDSKSLVSSWLTSTQNSTVPSTQNNTMLDRQSSTMLDRQSSTMLNRQNSTMLNTTVTPMDVSKSSNFGFLSAIEDTIQNNDTVDELEQTAPIVNTKVSKKKARYIKGF